MTTPIMAALSAARAAISLVALSPRVGRSPRLAA
jgi:hypothetical protein